MTTSDHEPCTTGAHKVPNPAQTATSVKRRTEHARPPSRTLGSRKTAASHLSTLIPLGPALEGARRWRRVPTCSNALPSPATLNQQLYSLPFAKLHLLSAHCCTSSVSFARCQHFSTASYPLPCLRVCDGRQRICTFLFPVISDTHVKRYVLSTSTRPWHPTKPQPPDRATSTSRKLEAKKQSRQPGRY